MIRPLYPDFTNLLVFESLYQTDFCNCKQTLGLLLLLYKFIKLSNKGAYTDRTLLMFFTFVWYNLRNCDNLVLCYLFTESAEKAALYGLYTAELPLSLNILFAYLMLVTDIRPEVSVSQELMKFTDTNLKYYMGFNDLSVD